MKKSLLLILAFRMLLAASAQNIGIEQYFSHQLSTSGIEHSSLFFIQHRSNIIAEIRYNYDAENVLSLNAGRAFQFERKKISSIIKPMIGLTIGPMTGINLNLDQEIEINNFYISSKFQYFFSLQDHCQNFFYTWVESGISFSKNFYGGFSLQINFSGGSSFDLSKGFVLGFSSGRWSFPVYLFEPISVYKSITAGIIYNIDFQKRT